VEQCYRRSPATELAARLIFLNRLCFNGLYRTNSSGNFNVPYGDYPAPTFPSATHLREVSEALKGATLLAGDFETTLSWCGPSDIVFADPPYHSPGNGFRKYHKLSFSEADQERLALALRAVHERGAIVFATNADHPFVRKLYSWAHAISTSERRAINCVGGGRSGVRCLLISTMELGCGLADRERR
jgi:DNA adenine methylase